MQFYASPEIVYRPYVTVACTKLNQTPPPPPPQVKFRNLPSDAYMIYEECKATLLNDASSRNNTPKHEAPLCARDWGINSNYIHNGS